MKFWILMVLACGFVGGMYAATLAPLPLPVVPEWKWAIWVVGTLCCVIAACERKKAGK